MTDWKTVNGSQIDQPEEFDTSSSSVVVYQRRNIHRVTVKNSMGDSDENTTEQWEYEERTMTPSEYLNYIAEKNRSDIEYLMAVTESAAE